jgi:hypothetical protein
MMLMHLCITLLERCREPLRRKEHKFRADQATPSVNRDLALFCRYQTEFKDYLQNVAFVNRKKEASEVRKSI